MYDTFDPLCFILACFLIFFKQNYRIYKNERKILMLTLTTDRLRVEISEPGECPNNGFRFDRAAYISEVVLDSERHFCANEPKNLIHPSSSGRGLCCEYGADYSNNVSEGKFYPKLGVGLIKKHAPYCFYEKYKDVEEFPIDILQTSNSIEFKTHAIECAGYAMNATKKLTIPSTKD